MSNVNTRATTPDLVILSLLTERPQHGYGLNAELERREVEDWAGVSRPQVYYSLKKLAHQGWIEPAESGRGGPGAERQVYQITELGRRMLRDGLARMEWATQKTAPAFLTWLALSPHASREAQALVLEKRSAFLQEQIERERGHLSGIRQDEGIMVPVAELMVRFTIAGFEQELSWLDEVRQTLNSAA